MDEMSKYQLVKKAIDKLDVYGLLEGGAPDDEFDSESKEISDRISENDSIIQIAEVITDVFNKAFDLHDKPSVYYSTAEEIRHLLTGESLDDINSIGTRETKMKKSFCFSKDLFPQIPVPHDCIIKSIHIENQCIVFDFEDDLSSYDSIAYWFPQAKTLTIRYHFSEDLSYSIYKWVKPNLFFKNGGYKCLADSVMDKNHSTLLNLTKSELEYIDHYVGYGYEGYSLFINLGPVVLACNVDVIEYEWKD